MPRRKKRRSSSRQTGTSNKKRDVKRKARPPGKRKSRRTGNTYYERRKNRSDMPGQMTGVKRTSINTASESQLLKALKDCIEVKRDDLTLKKLYKTKLKRDKKKIQKKINDCNSQLRKLEKPR